MAPSGLAITIVRARGTRANKLIWKPGGSLIRFNKRSMSESATVAQPVANVMARPTAPPNNFRPQDIPVIPSL